MGTWPQNPYSSEGLGVKGPLFRLECFFFRGKDKFDNKSKINNIKAPILIMHGEADQIVPFFMGKKIYEIANEPKYSYFTKHDNHMMEFDKNLVEALKSFLKSLN